MLFRSSNTALIALTHDPKIDDPALQHALKNNFFYIGALGSKKTHNENESLVTFNKINKTLEIRGSNVISNYECTELK